SEMLSVVGQLESQFTSEHAALADPGRAQQLVAQLRSATERSDQLRSQAARWQVTLNDGFADLATDVEHDLRSRLRALTREADEAIDASDPADAWDEFEQWLYRAATDHVVANPHELLQTVIASADVDLESGDGLGTGMNTLRGSYGGVLMFGVLGQLVGLGLINPVGLVAGLLFGGKSFRDERNRALAQRRAQAKNAHRKYTDELMFQVSKDSRDTIRHIQRQLRDRFASRAEELYRSSSEALSKAQQAIDVDEATREQRLEDVEAELARIRGLHDEVAALAPDLAEGGRS